MALSRVKKYEELRKSIEVNPVEENDTDTIENSAQLLKTFDSSVFKKVPIKDEEAKRRKSSIEEEPQKNSDTFTNEYLDDFMQEVRDYNIRKGNREFENTEVDILYHLNADNRKKRSEYVQDISEPENDVVNISEEIANLLEEDDKFNEPEISLELNEDTIENPPFEMIVDDHEDKKDDENKNDFNAFKLQLEEVKEINRDNHEVLLDQTRQMKKQLDTYEEELSGLTKDVSKTNKLLNTIFIFLVLLLLGLIGYVGYMIYSIGGF